MTKLPSTRVFLVYAALLVTAACLPVQAAVVYVDSAATGGNVGTSWDDAYTDLQSALGTAVSGDSIWVAKATYYPSSPSGRAATFQLVNGVSVYGGFAGGETNVSQRDWETNTTILSGDIGTVGNSADNSYHVVTGSGTDTTAVLDGFTITKGVADGVDPDLFGGGMYNASGSPKLVNVTVSHNSALLSGGGMYNTGGSPKLVNVTFSSNSVTIGYGGGMYNGGSSPTLERVVFSGNTGGGMYNAGGNPTLVDVMFLGNVGLGGMENHSSSPSLTNVMFWGNSNGTGGGGMSNYSSHPTLTNVTFSDNSGGILLFGGGGIYNDDSSPTLVNTVLWGDESSIGEQEIQNDGTSAPVVSYSLIEGGLPAGCSDGGNNVYADPLFVDGSGGNLRLRSLDSPAFNAGNNDAPNLAATDLDGNARIAGTTVDMGAYEIQITCPPDTVLYVDAGATGANDGTSWSDALTELRYALKCVPCCSSVTEIWVAEGIYTATAGTARDSTFQLLNGLAIYGGFAGTETMRSQRDWATNVTILSGDVGVEADSTDNSYHVVTGSGTDWTAVLDGFTITGGQADGSSGWQGFGGGMFNQNGSPTIANVTLSNNYGVIAGGMYNDGSSLTCLNVTFSDNSAGFTTGGMYNDSSNPTLANVVFWNNFGNAGGGGMSNENSSPTLTNVTFVNNTAYQGGGIDDYYSNPILINTILWGNSATLGHQIHNNGSTPAISHSLIQGSGGSGSWDTGLGTDGGNNIDADPLFVDASGGDMHLTAVSPAVNTGDNASPNLPATDIDGNPRIVGSTVDMGAHETPCPLVGTLYVDASATGANDGTSWPDAFTDLQRALGWAPCESVDEIWVSAGTYRPTSDTDRTATFQLASGAAVYGGFAGGETSVSERDWASNVTILSGDIGVVADSTDNSYHVVTSSGTDSTAVLDGFTMTGGYAHGGAGENTGGGMYNIGGSPTLTNVIFLANSAYAYAGGMYNYDHSNPKITNVIFAENSTEWSGGGGAGMCNSESSAPTLTNVIFWNNAANGYGGGIFNYSSRPTLINVTFSDNSANYGGGIYNNSSFPTLANTILWNNSAGTAGHEIRNAFGSTPIISYSLIDGSGGSSSWDTGLGTDGGGNIDADPLFVDAPAGDLCLAEGSPAIDAGTNDSIPAGVTTDLNGNPRVVPSSGTVDMGAYEYQAVASASAIPSPLVFTEVPGYQSTCDTIHVINDGGATCTIAGIYGCDTAPFSIDTTMTTHTLAPGDTTEIVVCVTPTVAGPDTAEVVVVSDAMNSPLTVAVRIDAVTGVRHDNTPKPFRIVSVSPNPFNPTTTVHFTLPAAMPVTAVIWSVTGTRVRVLAREKRFEPGDNRIVWDGLNDQGSQAASGVYFIRIETRLGAKVARALMLK